MRAELAGLSIGDTIDKLDTQVTDFYGLNVPALPSDSDQVLPFDITLAGANEYGAMAAAKILGVEILNEGTGVSVDDAVSEASATFDRADADQVSPSCRSNHASRAGTRRPDEAVR